MPSDIQTHYTFTHRGTTYRLQRDDSGCGHHWIDCTASEVDDGSSSCVAEAAYCALVEDGRTSFVSDAGIRYRWIARDWADCMAQENEAHHRGTIN